jgi:hypothetical protein
MAGSTAREIGAQEPGLTSRGRSHTAVEAMGGSESEGQADERRARGRQGCSPVKGRSTLVGQRWSVNAGRPAHPHLQLECGGAHRACSGGMGDSQAERPRPTRSCLRQGFGRMAYGGMPLTRPRVPTRRPPARSSLGQGTWPLPSLSPSVALACKGPLNARLATGVGLSFFPSFTVLPAVEDLTRGPLVQQPQLRAQAHLPAWVPTTRTGVRPRVFNRHALKHLGSTALHTAALDPYHLPAHTGAPHCERGPSLETSHRATFSHCFKHCAHHLILESGPLYIICISNTALTTSSLSCSFSMSSPTALVGAAARPGEPLAPAPAQPPRPPSPAPAAAPGAHSLHCCCCWSSPGPVSSPSSRAATRDAWAFATACRAAQRHRAAHAVQSLAWQAAARNCVSGAGSVALFVPA